MDEKSLSHTSWNCKYHIVLVPKYRRKVIYKDYFCVAKYLLGTPKPLNCIRWMQAA